MQNTFVIVFCIIHYTFSAAKVMLFFELCKKTHTFFVIFLHFLPNRRKFAENSAFFRRKSQNSGIFRMDSVR